MVKHAPDGDHLTPAERREVERHKYYLSERAGHDVGFDFAARDWREKHAPQFHQARMLKLQSAEIARHKWLESEKAGRDIGRDAALDWVKRYAAQWRAWYNREHGSPS